MKPIPAGVDLLQQCAGYTDAKGRPCNELMILSNWNTESFEKLKARPEFDPIFKLIQPENISISGRFQDRRGLKPNLMPFDTLITAKQRQNAQLTASDFIFLDDQQVNVDAARSCGMQAFLVNPYDPKSYEQVAAELRKLGALPQEDGAKQPMLSRRTTNTLLALTATTGLWYLVRWYRGSGVTGA